MAFDVRRLLLSAGIVSEADLERAREIQGTRGGSLPRVCRDLGLLDQWRWVRVVAKALSLPTIDLETVDVDLMARGKAPEFLLRELAAFPFQLRDDGQVLGVAMAEPQDDVGRAQLRAATGCELEIGVAGYDAIEQALFRYPHPDEASELEFKEEEAETGVPTHSPPEDRHPLETVEESSAGLTMDQVRLLDSLAQAAGRSASALRAAVDLCVERDLFTADELGARVNRKT